MLGASFIDTAIGIAFVFLLLSLIASSLNEILLSFLNMRGKDLLAGLKTLLNDERAEGLVKDLYNHGLIFGLFRGDFNPKKAGNLPSYIPPANFASAFLDVVRDPAAKPAGAEAGAATAQNASPDSDATAEQTAAARIRSIREAAEQMTKSNEKVGKPLVTMVDAAGTDIFKLRKSLEDWYNSAMDRVSGHYKYRTQWTLFGIGLVLAIALNADTVRIVKQLSTDPTLRQSIVAAAQSAKPPESGANGPVKDGIKAAHDQVDEFQNIGIPLGWAGTHLPCSNQTLSKCKEVGQETYKFVYWLILGWLPLVRGWLLTAIAVSLGAPFWFDLLNKFMVVRSTVKPREKSQEEGAKDKK